MKNEQNQPTHETTPPPKPQPKLPWQRPTLRRAEITFDTAASGGSNIDGAFTGSQLS